MAEAMSTLSVNGSTGAFTVSVNASTVGITGSQSTSTVGSGISLKSVETDRKLDDARYMPSGDRLPAIFNMALIKRLPMFPQPTSVLEFYTRKIGQPVYRNKGRIDFDLRDPYNFNINTEYDSLSDPHMLIYLSNPRVYKRLQDLGQLTHDGNVRCSRKKYHRYSNWLQQVGQQQFYKKAQNERKRVGKERQNAESDDSVKVAVIHAVSQEEATTSTGEMEEQCRSVSRPESSGETSQAISRGGGNTSANAQTQERDDVRALVMQSSVPAEMSNGDGKGLKPDYQLEQQLEMARRQQEREKARAAKRTKARLKKAAEDCYTRANNEHRKRQKKELQDYSKTWQKCLDNLMLVEERRQENAVKKLQEGYKPPRLYNKQYEDPPQLMEDDEARAARFKRQLQDEMNKRWQSQAGRMKAQKEKAKEKYNDLEQTYTRNFIKAFAGPGAESSEQVSKEEEMVVPQESTGILKTSGMSDQLPKRPPLKEPPATEAKLLPSAPKGSSNYLHATRSREGSTCVSSQGHTTGKHSGTDVKSPSALTKHPSKRTQEKFRDSVTAKGIKTNLSSYPTKTKVLHADDPNPHPADEVRIFIPYELIVQNTQEEVSRSQSELVAEDVKPMISSEPPSEEDDKRAPTCEKQTEEERVQMEELVERLLKDLSNDHLDKKDMVQLAALCAALTESSLMEQATSTTSLGEERRLREGAQCSDTSMATTVDSERARQSVDRSARSSIAERTPSPLRKQSSVESVSSFVDDVVRRAVRQLGQDLEDGTLSREDVREIGSAVASVILGELESDSTVLEEEVVVPTLQQLLEETDDIDEHLLDQTMACLLCAYSHVTRRTDKPLWKAIKDFVLEVLQRTKDAMEAGRQNKAQFLLTMEKCQKTPLHKEMELPCLHELLEVMAIAISKLAAMEELCPVLCELTKIMLDQGQTILLRRHSDRTINLPKLDDTVLQQVGTSACGLEVALEVAATVCDGLSEDMHEDAPFERSLYLSLAPSFLLVLLTCWAEMTAAVPKETASSQTAFMELGYVPTLGENVILLCYSRLWRDTTQDRLSPQFVTLLTLQLAQLPVLDEGPCELQYDEEGRVIMSDSIKKKINRITRMVRGEAVNYEECKKLVAAVLHTYMHCVMLMQPEASNVSPELLEDTKESRYHVTDLVINVTRDLLVHVQELVKGQEAVNENSTISLMLVTDILQIMADCALADMKDSMEGRALSLSCSRPDDPQLQHILNVIDPKDDNGQRMGVGEFLQTMMVYVEKDFRNTQRPIVLNTNLKTAGQLIRAELGKMARDVCELMTGMADMSQQPLAKTSAMDKMVRFIISLLQKFTHVVKEEILSKEVSHEFLCTVARDLCSSDDDQYGVPEMLDVLNTLICDIQVHRSRSKYFRRLVRKLSKMSIESPNTEKVAEGMAAIAHVLGSVDTSILNQFVQTTLFSLLSNLRATARSIPTKPSVSLDGQSDTVSGSTISTYVDPADVMHKRVQSEDESMATTMESYVMESTELQAPSLIQDRDKLVGPGKIQGADNVGESTELQDSDEIILQQFSCSDSQGMDTESKKEISNEAEILIHTTLQMLLERMGVKTRSSPTAASRQPKPYTGTKHAADKEAKELVSNLQDIATQSKPGPCKDFSDLDPTVAAYAHDLLKEVVQHMEDSMEQEESGEEEAIAVMHTDSIATLILNNTFKSIETSLTSGKLQTQAVTPPLTTSENIRERTSLTSCVTNTLCAVRSELDLLNMEEEPASGSSGLFRSDCPQTMQRARRIVNFLIQRLQTDTSGAKLHFRWTAQHKLSVVSQAPDVVRVDSSVWSSSPSVLAETIFQMLRHVLKDMHHQNQFFNPDDQEPVTVCSSDVFTLPSLPFLLDEFILSHLQFITAQLLRYVLGQDPNLYAMTKEAVMVACTFNDIVREMKDMAFSAHEQSQDDVDRRRMVVLSTMEEYVTKLLIDLCGTRSEHIMSIVETHRKSIQKVEKVEFEKTEPKKMEHPQRLSLVVCRPQSQVRNDLGKLLSSLDLLKEEMYQTSESDASSLSNDSQNDKDIVLQAINHICSCVRRDRVADDILSDLFHIFIKDLTEIEGKDNQREKLLMELDNLAEDIMRGHIGGAKLVRVATDISMLERRHVEDPRRIAQQVRRVSLTGHTFSPEYLKMALSDLLAGFQKSNNVPSALPEGEVWYQPTIESSPADHYPQPPALGLEDDDSSATSLRRQQTHDYESDGASSEQIRKENTVAIQQSSIDSRTISKMCIMADDSENRESSLRTVYSAQVSLKNSPISFFKEQTIIVEQSDSQCGSSSNQLRVDYPPSDKTGTQEEGKVKDETEPEIENAAKESTDSMAVAFNSTSFCDTTNLEDEDVPSSSGSQVTWGELELGSQCSEITSVESKGWTESTDGVSPGDPQGEPEELDTSDANTDTEMVTWSQVELGTKCSEITSVESKGWSEELDTSDANTDSEMVTWSQVELGIKCSEITSVDSKGWSEELDTGDANTDPEMDTWSQVELGTKCSEITSVDSKGWSESTDGVSPGDPQGEPEELDTSDANTDTEMVTWSQVELGIKCSEITSVDSKGWSEELDTGDANTDPEMDTWSQVELGTKCSEITSVDSKGWSEELDTGDANTDPEMDTWSQVELGTKCSEITSVDSKGWSEELDTGDANTDPEMDTWSQVELGIKCSEITSVDSKGWSEELDTSDANTDREMAKGVQGNSNKSNVATTGDDSVLSKASGTDENQHATQCSADFEDYVSVPEEEGKEVQVTESGSSNANRSEDSLTMVDEDRNRSAVRTTRQNYVTQIDKVLAFQSLPSKHRLLPHPLDQELCSQGRETKQKDDRRIQEKENSREQENDRNGRTEKDDLRRQKKKKREKQETEERQRLEKENEEIYQTDRCGREDSGRQGKVQSGEQETEERRRQVTEKRERPEKEDKGRQEKARQRASKVSEASMYLQQPCDIALPSVLSHRAHTSSSSDPDTGDWYLQHQAREPQNTRKCQSGNAVVQNSIAIEARASVQTYQSFTTNGQSVGCKMSVTSSNTMSQTKASVCVSTHSPASVSVHAWSQDSAETQSPKKGGRGTWALHPYLQKQVEAQQYNARALTGQEKRIQHRALASGFSLFGSRDITALDRKHRRDRNVNRRESETLTKNSAFDTQDPVQSSSKLSRFPFPYLQTLRKETRFSLSSSRHSQQSHSKRCCRAGGRESSSAACSKVEGGDCQRPLVMPHPPPSNPGPHPSRPHPPPKHSHHSDGGCTHQTTVGQDPSQQRAEFLPMPERTVLEKKDRAKSTPENARLSSLSSKPVQTAGSPRCKDAVCAKTHVHSPVTFPDLPHPSSHTDVNAKSVLKGKSDSLAVPLLPHPPKGSHRIVVSELKSKLQHVIRGLRPNQVNVANEETRKQHGFMDQQKKKPHSTVELDEHSSKLKLIKGVKPRNSMVQERETKQGVLVEEGKPKHNELTDQVPPKLSNITQQLKGKYDHVTDEHQSMLRHRSGLPVLPPTFSGLGAPHPRSHHLAPRSGYSGLKGSEGAADGHADLPRQGARQSGHRKKSGVTRPGHSSAHDDVHADQNSSCEKADMSRDEYNTSMDQTGNQCSGGRGSGHSRPGHPVPVDQHCSHHAAGVVKSTQSSPQHNICSHHSAGVMRGDHTTAHQTAGGTRCGHSSPQVRVMKLDHAAVHGTGRAGRHLMSAKQRTTHLMPHVPAEKVPHPVPHALMKRMTHLLPHAPVERMTHLLPHASVKRVIHPVPHAPMKRMTHPVPHPPVERVTHLVPHAPREGRPISGFTTRGGQTAGPGL